MTAKIINLAEYRARREAAAAAPQPVMLSAETKAEAIRALMLLIGMETEQAPAPAPAPAAEPAPAPTQAPEATSAPKHVPAYSDPENERRGPKYEARLSTKEVAARVRKEIRTAIKTGELPKGLKVSVRYESFAGGSAIRVAVTAWQGGRILNPERLRLEWEDPHAYVTDRDCPRYTPEATALLEKLSSYAEAYKRDNSDSMSDYFDVNFYGGEAAFEYELEDAERAAFRRWES